MKPGSRVNGDSSMENILSKSTSDQFSTLRTGTMIFFSLEHHEFKRIFQAYYVIKRIILRLNIGFIANGSFDN